MMAWGAGGKAIKSRGHVTSGRGWVRSPGLGKGTPLGTGQTAGGPGGAHREGWLGRLS